MEPVVKYSQELFLTVTCLLSNLHVFVSNEQHEMLLAASPLKKYSHVVLWSQDNADGRWRGDFSFKPHD